MRNLSTGQDSIDAPTKPETTQTLSDGPRRSRSLPHGTIISKLRPTMFQKHASTVIELPRVAAEIYTSDSKSQNQVAAFYQQ